MRKKLMDKLHKIQLNILRVLLFAKTKRYSDIKPYDMEGSQFKYHMDRLIEYKLISKELGGTYSLTSTGKEVANQMNSIKISMGKQAKVTANICCVRRLNASTEYLLYTRKKNPFYGFQGFPTSKIWYGDSFIDGAKKGLFNETNLTGNPKLLAIRHYRVFDNANDHLLEDKVMYIFRFDDPIGSLKSKKDGEFAWIKEEDFHKFIINPLPEFEEIFKLLNSRFIEDFFKEVVHFVDINKF